MKHWKLSVFLGVLYGLIAFYFSYAMLNGTMGMWKGTLLFYFIMIPIGVIGIYYSRKKDNGIISFTECLLICIVIIIIGVILSQLINGVYVMGVTEQEQDKMMDLIVENHLETVNYMEIDELEYEDQVRHQMKSLFTLNIMTIGTSVVSIFLMTIIGFVISLIMYKEKLPAE